MSIVINKPGKSVLIGALVPVGSRDENSLYKGVSHFLEHMMFKGTTNRTQKQLTSEVEKYGAYFNAYTSEECTFYYIEISKQYADVARAVIDDMVRNSVLPEEELKKEREVVLQELQMYEDNPQTAIFEAANRHVYLPFSGLYIPIIGTRDTLARINRHVMLEHYGKYYRNPIKLEIGATSTDNTDILTLPRKFEIECANDILNDTLITRPGITQANMLITGLTNLNPDVVANDFALKLYASCMNGFTGRLFQEIREKHNMVYHVSFGYNIFSCGTAQYYIYAALDPKQIQEAKQLILNELTRPLTEEEISFAVTKWIGQYDLSRDKITNIAKRVIDCIIRAVPYHEYDTKAVDNIQLAKGRVLEFQKTLNVCNTSKLLAIVPEGNI